MQQIHRPSSVISRTQEHTKLVTQLLLSNVKLVFFDIFCTNCPLWIWSSVYSDYCDVTSTAVIKQKSSTALYSLPVDELTSLVYQHLH